MAAVLGPAEVEGAVIPPRKALYAASKNKNLILEVLRTLQPPRRRILEIATGTGEHAETFLSALVPEGLELYQPTEMDESMHASIEDWTMKEFASVCRPPLMVDVTMPESYASIQREFDCLVNINMIHISPARTTADLFDVASRLLLPSGLVLMYGPYQVNGEMVESNHSFDASLKTRNSAWGIRDLEWVEATARERGFVLSRTVAMPANNLSIVFTRADAPLV